jgi:hypothetical protein
MKLINNEFLQVVVIYIIIFSLTFTVMILKLIELKIFDYKIL